MHLVSSNSKELDGQDQIVGQDFAKMIRIAAFTGEIFLFFHLLDFVGKGKKKEENHDPP